MYMIGPGFFPWHVIFSLILIPSPRRITHLKMPANGTGLVTYRRSGRCHVPNINRLEVLTLGEAAQLRAHLVGGVCNLTNMARN